MRAARRGIRWILSLFVLLALCSVGTSPSSGGVGVTALAGDNRGKIRIAYVTNTWWPKVDGAAITVMAHAYYFAEAGHPVLVVRPQYPALSPVLRRAMEAGMESDPVPPSGNLSFLSYRMLGNRGGGFEPEMHAGDLARVESSLAEWKPDVSRPPLQMQSCAD